MKKSAFVAYQPPQSAVSERWMQDVEALMPSQAGEVRQAVRAQAEHEARANDYVNKPKKKFKR